MSLQNKGVLLYVYINGNGTVGIVRDLFRLISSGEPLYIYVFGTRTIQCQGSIFIVLKSYNGNGCHILIINTILQTLCSIHT